MLKQPVTLILLLVFIFPIAKGFIFKFSSKFFKGDIQGAFQSVAFLCSLGIGISYTKKIFIQHDEGIYKSIYETIPEKVTGFLSSNTMLIYIVLMPLVVIILYSIISSAINAINRISIYPLFDGIENGLKSKSIIFKRIVGALFQVPKAICYVVVIVFIINFLSFLGIAGSFDKYFQQSKLYSYISKEVVIPLMNSELAKKLPNIVDNSFKIVVKETKPSGASLPNNKSIITYYNGVTLEEGIKSSDEIDAFAINLVKNSAKSIEKARLIYKWVGTEIIYDDEKASKVLNNDLKMQSGAVPTFKTKSGICFDYACLFAAMGKANNMKVRIVTGQGYNGSNWVNHAWNQIYIDNEDRWINVDSTFLIGGNYFDNVRFDLDHKDDTIVGEW